MHFAYKPSIRRDVGELTARTCRFQIGGAKVLLRMKMTFTFFQLLSLAFLFFLIFSDTPLQFDVELLAYELSGLGIK